MSDLLDKIEKKRSFMDYVTDHPYLLTGVGVFGSLVAWASTRYKVALPNEKFLIRGPFCSRYENGTKICNTAFLIPFQ
jgi:hypothetical protein